MKISEDSANEAIFLYKSGESPNNISKRFNISTPTLYNILDKHNVPRIRNKIKMPNVIPIDSCLNCGNELPRQRKKSFRKRYYCNFSCRSTHKNKINNPMKNESSRKKASESLKGRKTWNKNRPWPEEIRAKMRGPRPSLQTPRPWLKGKMPTPWNKGKTKYNSEKLMRLALAAKGRPNSSSTKFKSGVPHKIKFFNTKPERMLDAALKTHSLVFERDYNMVGKPDFAFPELKLAVFVDGCYWHNCPEHFPNEPRKGRKRIDHNVNVALRKLDWIILRFWEHDIYKDVNTCANSVLGKITEISNGKKC